MLLPMNAHALPTFLVAHLSHWDGYLTQARMHETLNLKGIRYGVPDKFYLISSIAAPRGVQSFVFQLKTNNLPTTIWLHPYIIQMFLQCFLRNRAQENSLQRLPCASTLH